VSTDRQRDADLDRLLRATLRRDSAIQPDACPDAGMLAAVVEGGVSVDERAPLEEHLAACGRCQETLAAMDLEAPASSQAPTPAVAAKRPWLWRGHLHWLIPVAAASMLVIYLASKPAIAPYFPPGRPAPDTQMADARTSQFPPAESVERTAPPPAAVTDKGKTGVDEQTVLGPAAPAAGSAPPAQARRSDAAAPAFAPKPVPLPAKGEQAAASGTFAMRTKQDVDAAKKAAEPAAPQPASATPAVAPPVTATVNVTEAAPPSRAGLPAGGEARLTATKAAAPAAAAPPTMNQVLTATAPPPAAEGIIAGAELSKTDAKGAAVAAAANVQSKGDASERALRAAPSDLVVVSAPGGRIQWRVGSNGGIWRSADEGKTWYPQKSGVKSALLAAAAPSVNACWAVGVGGTVLLTDDGERWERRPFPERTDLVMVDARSSHEAIVTTRDGRRFATANRGATWTLQR